MVGQTQDIAYQTYGVTSCALDPCAFVIQKSGKINGVLGVHVDDVIGDGNETFDRITTAMRKEFDFGAGDIDNVRFKGRLFRRCQMEKYVCDTEQYKYDLGLIEVSKVTFPELKRSIPNSEEALGNWPGLWIIAVHSYHFS